LAPKNVAFRIDSSHDSKIFFLFSRTVAFHLRLVPARRAESRAHVRGNAREKALSRWLSGCLPTAKRLKTVKAKKDKSSSLGLPSSVRAGIPSWSFAASVKEVIKENR
jgi:hypothetical protein